MVVNKEFTFSEENKEKIEYLKNEIFKAFANVEQPAKDNIALHECEECRGVREDFANVRWQEASDELLEGSYDKLPLFSPQAFNYFLPAFLIYTLDNFDDFYSEVCEFTLYALTPEKSWIDEKGEISKWYKQKFAPFTLAQMNLIYQFLALAKENPIYMTNITSIERVFDRLKTIKAASQKI